MAKLFQVREFRVSRILSYFGLFGEFVFSNALWKLCLHETELVDGLNYVFLVLLA